MTSIDEHIQSYVALTRKNGDVVKSEGVKTPDGKLATVSLTTNISDYYVVLESKNRTFVVKTGSGAIVHGRCLLFVVYNGKLYTCTSVRFLDMWKEVGVYNGTSEQLYEVVKRLAETPEERNDNGVVPAHINLSV